jgi:YbbR domain-containing protein
MKKKNRPNWFLRILYFLFLIFIVLLLANKNGYYESKVAKKATMTEESIKQFEQDIKDNKPIDINDYTTYEVVDYHNTTTDIAIFISENVEKLMSTGLTDLFDVLKRLFT